MAFFFFFSSWHFEQQKDWYSLGSIIFTFNYPVVCSYVVLSNALWSRPEKLEKEKKKKKRPAKDLVCSHYSINFSQRMGYSG